MQNGGSAMTSRPTSPRFTLQNAAVVVASLLVPVPVLAASIAEAVLDSTNPMQLDITQDFAYFDAMLLWGFGTLAIMIGVVAALFVMIYRRTRDLRELGLPIVVLTLQLVLWVVLLLLGQITNEAESAYRALL